MDKHPGLADHPPVAVEMRRRVHERALEHDEPDVEEPKEVAKVPFHRVVPEGVDDGPGEDVAVVPLGDRNSLGKEYNAASGSLT